MADNHPAPSDMTDPFTEAVNAYGEKFGHLPVGIGMPPLTTELLNEAVRTGQPVRGMSLPRGDKR